MKCPECNIDLAINENWRWACTCCEYIGRMATHEEIQKDPENMISFFVPGIPAPQGSKTPWGTEANPRTKPWREAIKYAVLQAWFGEQILTPVFLSLTFFFPRPKNHFNSKGDLKKSAPVYKQSKPDLDKLIRAFCDAITDAGNIWRDDSQVVCFELVEKVYIDSKNPNPGVFVEIKKVGV